MIVLGILVWLSPPAVGLIGLVLVAGHNLFDHFDFPAGSLSHDLWTLAHVRRPLQVWGATVLVTYPLLPWLGVLLFGYGYGPILERPRTDRRGTALFLGLLLCAAFVLLRALRLYGDPSPWVAQESPVLSAISFLSASKYPPSLQFVAMTLGPGLLALAAFDRRPGWLGRRLATLGRVPLLFYVAHILALSVASKVFYRVTTGVAFRTLHDGAFPPGYGNGLGTVYLAWACACLALYPLCAWYAGVKRRSSAPVLAYL